LSNHTLTSCGTPAFAAPEVLKQQKYSTKADVFSFAIVLWEIWVRKTPYYGKLSFFFSLLFSCG
jgi:serine/threonine protein kinase